MLTLVSVNTHNNSIAVFKKKTDKLCYVKISSTNKSTKSLINEHEGWKWYGEKILKKNSLAQLEIRKKNYARLKLKSFSGKIVDYTNTLDKNIADLSKFVDYFCEYWPSKFSKPRATHCDLTFSNIIWSDIPQIIDWEHFSRKNIFWGYDVIYLILSAIILPNQNFTIPSKMCLEKIGEMFVRLGHKGIKRSILEQPCASVRRELKEKVLPFANCDEEKFFPLKLSELETDILDECLVRAYRYAVYDEYLQTFKSK